MLVTRATVAAACVAVALTGCSAETSSRAVEPPPSTASPPVASPPTTVPASTSPVSAPPATSTQTTSPSTTVAAATTIPARETSAPTTTTTEPTTTPYVVPVAAVELAGWGDTHSSYPATDIFVACGAELVSPVNGVVLEVRRVDGWDPDVDNPATRGGRSVSILGDDGVRYYLAHFDVVAEPLAVDDRVVAGQRLGTMGSTGRSSACHLHFGISPPCPGTEWSVRRGAIWPYPYLDAWRQGEPSSPVEEVAAWVTANPDACAEAMADPTAADA